MFALFGAAGQVVYTRAMTRSTDSPPIAASNSEAFSWMNSKWSPVKVLSDTEYKKMLQEKLLRVNVEIALVDDSIKDLRAQEREIAAKKAVPESKESSSK
jgi:hypothetical protein